MKVREGSNVKITYYGTGDGYGIPEPFCSCRLCSYARAHGGKDIRTRSQATVDDIMIDCSSDMFAHQAFYGLDMRKYRHILITHGHSDHYAVSEMTAPKRTICSTVRTAFPDAPVLPVRVSADIPKDRIFDVMDAIRAVTVTERIARGDVVIPDVLGLGVDVIATSSLLKHKPD